jgi:predicted deacetylase
MNSSIVCLESARLRPAASWLPPGKCAAICFSVDDVHPSTSRDAYEAGGDLEAGALGRLIHLQRRHRDLKATLCVTPDWRLDSLIADGALLRHIPWVKRFVHYSRLQPAGRFRLDRHPKFVAFLNHLERCEMVPHGLHHAHVGARRAVEFQDQSQEHCAAIVQRGLDIFEAAKLRFVRGYVPPAWNAPPALIAALGQMEFRFITSARDLKTPISTQALTAMSGLRGLTLIHPQTVGDRGLVHLPCNFQATSDVERAVAILEQGGMLHIKAHIFKTDGRHVMADGLDELYTNYLDLLFTMLERRFGAQLWWAHLSEIAERFRGHH